MSLATRCTSCGTIFRVVQDQLKVSEGWVRCGRCEQVFNALEGLFDLERDTPPDWNDGQEPAPSSRATAPSPAPVPAPMPAPAPFLRPPAPPEEPDPEPEYDPQLVDRIDEQLLGSRRHSAFGALTSLGSPKREHADFADARFDPDLIVDTGTDAEPSMPIPLIESTQPVSAPAPEAEAAPLRVEADDTPDFVQRAEREQRWRSSGARKGLLASCGLLVLLLVGQVLNHYRDAAAARLPGLQPLLAAWCEASGCTLQAPRRLEDIVVESTALAKTTSPADGFRLSVVLRNNAPTAAATPWIELTLKDANEQRVARRALGPQDFRLASATLAPGADVQLQALLTTGSLPVAGYTVEIFYP